MKYLKNLLLVFLFFMLSTTVFAQFNTIPRQDAYSTNGSINKIVADDDHVYLGGSFDVVGEYTGNGVAFKKATMIQDNNFPKFSGRVNIIVPDGQGGWFFGGAFKSVAGKTASGFAHIINGNQVDTLWLPEINDEVHSITVWGNRVYVGGDFSEINGAARKGIAAFDKATGQLTDWNPESNRFSMVGSIYSMVPGENTLYVGGIFKNIGGQDRNSIAELDTSSGTATSWDPHDGNPNLGDLFFNKIISKDSLLILAGTFHAIGDSARKNLAIVKKSNGEVVPFSFDMTRDEGPQGLYDMQLLGDTLYVAGGFDTFGGLNRKNLVAINLINNTITDWDPQISGFEAYVSDIEIYGNTVFVCGDFTAIGDSSRQKTGSFDLLTGQPSPWDPLPGGSVLCLAVSDVSVLVGGSFTIFDGISRKNLVQIDKTSGMATDWDPQLSNGAVEDLYIHGNTLYVAGSFFMVGGQSQKNVAAINLSDGTLQPWNPEPGSRVYSIVATNGKVFLGGGFWYIGAVQKKYLAAVDSASGTLLSFEADLGGQILDMHLNNTDLYLAGDFQTIGQNSRKYIGAVDINSGNALSFDPQSNSRVEYVENLDGKVYAGGNFTEIGGQNRAGFAEFDASTGLMTSLDVSLQSDWNPAVFSVVKKDSFLLIGGNFKQVADSARSGLAVISANTGKPTGWKADAVADGSVYINTSLQDGEDIYLGGSFDAINNVGLSNFAVLNSGATGFENRFPNSNPVSFRFVTNYPNPFNPVTKIEFYLPKGSETEIYIYDVLGRKIADLSRTFKFGGTHQINFDASVFASGTYFYTITNHDVNYNGKMHLIK